MSTPYAAYVRQFTARLRARVHQQSFVNVVQNAERRMPTAAGNIADARMRVLTQLVQQHRRTCEPSLREKALSILQTLPLKSTNEDPHFSHTFAGLNACAHFHAVNAPATYSFINHLTRHTFMLDGRGIFQFYLVLVQLQHPQTAEIAQILLPRIREVVGDFTISEARLIMEFLAKLKLLDADLTQQLTSVMQGGLQDVTLLELSRCVAAMDVMSSVEVARGFFAAAAPRICQALQESVAQRHYYKTLYFVETATFTTATAAAADTSSSAKNGSPVNTCTSHVQVQDFLLDELRTALRLIKDVSNAVIRLSWGPRRVLNELVRTTIAWSEPDTLTSNSPSNYLIRRQSAAEGDFVGHEKSAASIFSDAEEQHYAEYLQKLPQITRLHMSYVLKALHFSSYRHPTGLRILSARVAASERVTMVNPASMRVVDELPLTIEAVAYFYATDCLPAVLSMLEDVQTNQLAGVNAKLKARVTPTQVSPEVLSPEERDTAEAVVLRMLLSCARLLSVCAGTTAPPTAPSISSAAVKMLPSNRPVKPEMQQELCQHIVTLATSPLLQLYVDHARVVAVTRQETGTAWRSPRRPVAGAAHVLHSIAVLFDFISENAKCDEFVKSAMTFMDEGSLAVLRGTMQRIVKLVQTVAEHRPDTLATETVTEIRTTLQMVQRHPEWMAGA